MVFKQLGRWFYEKIVSMLFVICPSCFPKKKKKIEAKFNELFQQRWSVILEKLNLIDIITPKTEVDFASGTRGYYLKKTIFFNSYILDGDQEQLVRTVDHEIAHYIQNAKNSFLKKRCPFILIPSGLFWFITHKMDRQLTRRAFEEGFASFVAKITSGIMHPDVEKAIKEIQLRKRWSIMSSSALSYSLGFLIFSTIAESKSVDYAISVGLSDDYSQWLEEGKTALSELNEELPI